MNAVEPRTATPRPGVSLRPAAANRRRYDTAIATARARPIGLLAAAIDALARGERLQPWRWLFGFSLLVATLTRIALMLETGARFEPTIGKVALILLLGPCFDAAAAGYLLLPLVLLLAALPLRWRRTAAGRAFLLAAMCGGVFMVLFTAAAEWVFWREFGTRFNFIAVDYLVYTQEVIVNLWESYPLPSILAALLLASTVLVWRQATAICGRPGTGASTWGNTLVLAALACWPFVVYSSSDVSAYRLFANRYANEIAGNGPYGFFHAFRSAELNYAEFYPKLPDAVAYARARSLLRTMTGGRYARDDSHGVQHEVAFAAAPRRLNVVLISVESLSASYLGHFGNRMKLTPNLDRLANEGLLFTDFYATGTRTVRGLEALTLSVPPTPGESIVKRPDNGGLTTLGGLLAERGYDVRFLYGGNARFDNMRTFFAGNGYEVVDRGAIPDERIHHENAWGVADEDIYTQALRDIGHSARAGRPSFTHIMTTSNHRPYSYPEHRIDMPSAHSGRPGAVKYTDWAIGDFIDRARHESWFPDTLFVIVADHCASSAGKTDLPLHRYHIPLLLYGPAIVAPGTRDELASQIDVAPTVLAFLRQPYRGPFFGRDLLQPTGRSLALISTYQALGFLRDNRLVELVPQGAARMSRVSGHSPDPAAGTDQALIDDAIAYYEVAADALRRGALRRGSVGGGTEHE